ncbi:MAG: M48 family metalloprotease [Halieaceae bacterium]
MSLLHRFLIAPLVGLVLALASLQVYAESVGDEMYRKFVEEGAIYDNPELSDYITRIGRSLVTSAKRDPDDFTFTVIDSPDINAFATPGGYVYMNRGLLAYLDNEAELAGVLSHEVAHITANHSTERRTAGVASKVLSTTVYILTGSGDLADASNMYGTELVSGYGRDQELEADGLGSEYMFKSGYEPEALLEVIGVLKDQEMFQRVKAKETGRKKGSYHGLYATHPRNDKRLQTVIRAANELQSDEYLESPEVPGEFQRHLNGLVWGASLQGQRPENRFYHNKLKFTFAHPEGWSVNTASQKIIASASDGSASMKISIRRRDPAQSPQVLMESLASGSLTEGKALEQAGLKGYTANSSAGGASKRLAVIDYRYTYLFEGSAKNFDSSDADLLSIVESFRPMHPKEGKSSEPRYVQYIQVPRGATMASLAASSQIPDAEAQLRLINGFYPRGEPRVGDWIKIIR